MLWNAMINLAIMAGGVLQFLGQAGGLIFLVLAIGYLFSEREDGNMFWYFDEWEEDEE